MNILQKVFEEYWKTQLVGLIGERQMAIDFYSNAHDEHIRKIIKIDADDLPITWTGLTKRIVDKRSQIYKKPAARSIGDGAISDTYAEVTISKNFWMKEAERRARLTGVIALRPVWDGVKFDYQIIQNFLPIFADDGITPIGITYPINSESKADQRWVYWDKDNHFVTDADGIHVENQSDYGVNENKENPYGILPFAFLHISPVVNDFWTPGAFDVVNTNLMIDVAMTSLNYELRYQSFKQLYTTGLNAVDSANIRFGYKNMPNLPTDATLNVLDLQASPQNTIEAIKFQIQNIERNYGLNIAWGMEGSPSGFSLMVQNIDLLQGWEDDKDIAKEWERDIYEIEQAVFFAETRKLLPDNFSVDLAEVSFPVNKQEEMAYWDWMVSHNVTTYADYYVEKINPDVSADEAQAIIEANAKKNGTVTKAAAGPTALDKLLGA